MGIQSPFAAVDSGEQAIAVPQQRILRRRLPQDRLQTLPLGRPGNLTADRLLELLGIGPN